MSSGGDAVIVYLPQAHELGSGMSVALRVDLPPQEIAFAVAPLFTAMASAFGQARTVRILEACKEAP
jgi:hypothetical protein